MFSPPERPHFIQVWTETQGACYTLANARSFAFPRTHTIRGFRVNTADSLSDSYGISLGTGRGARRRALGQNIRGQGGKDDYFFPSVKGSYRKR
jgi:hypothetical protein